MHDWQGRTPLLDSDLETLLANPEEKREIERRLLQKLDTRMSMLVLIYILDYIDRQNLAVARLQGFEEDLGLQGSQYALCLGIVYVGYLFMQIPSNILLEYTGKPSIYLSICMILWGLTFMLIGAARGFYDILFARLFLGCLEAPFVSGAYLLMARWYRRDEIGQRTAWLACGILIANATGSLISSGILKIFDSIPGIPSWRGLFVTEGALTLVIALSAWYILPDFPETSSDWLTPLEQALAVRRIQEDSASDDILETQGHLEGLWLAVSDWKVWWLSAILAVYSFSSSFFFYFPTLVQTIGYSPITTLLISIPPWLTAILVVILISRRSDYHSERFLHISFSILVAVIGYFLAMSTMNPFVRYVSFFLMTQILAAYTCFMAWASCVVSDPPRKRTTGLAIITTVYAVANITAPFTWPSEWGPDYTKSFGISVFAAFLMVILSWTFRQQLAKLNERQTVYLYQL